MPVIGFLSGRSLASDAHLVTAFRQGLNEAGYVEGRSVQIRISLGGGAIRSIAGDGGRSG
jgi:hypothetical protein